MTIVWFGPVVVKKERVKDKDQLKVEDTSKIDFISRKRLY